jgi:RNA polymerase sigma-70 factor (ECF subfamily)
VDDCGGDSLVAAYLERRDELIRYFRLRLRSLEAAQDVVQDIYLKIARRPDEDVANPGAYLYRVGANSMLDYIKKERRLSRRATAWSEIALEGGGNSAAADDPGADRVVEGRERLNLILAAVAQMPAPVREAFRLHKLEGLTHGETAAAMGVSRSSVEKYIMSALKRIVATVGR